MPEGDQVGVIKISAVTWGAYEENESKVCEDPSKVNPDLFVRPGDFLFSRANTIELVGACVIAGRVTKRVMLSDKILRFHFALPVDKWVLYFLRSMAGRAQIEKYATGNQESMRNIGQERIRRIELPVAPLPEQHRIVAEIEKHFTRLDAAVATLTRVQAEIERARASVLKAAVEGRLVPTEAALARAEGRSYEQASVLLERVLEERRRKYAELHGKKKYKPPVEPETDELPELPEGWAWATMDALLVSIEAGRSFQCNPARPAAHEIGIVKVSAVTWGTYDEDEAKTVDDPAMVNPSYFIEPGDFLFSRANTIDLVGACVIATKVTRKTMLSDKILRLRTVDPAWDPWLLATLRSLHGRRQIEALATGNQDSMRNIGQDRIRRIAVPIPPRAERERIVAEVSRRLSVFDTLAHTVARNLARCTALRQSILERAFSGKLVPQDPSDEPASALLERIRASTAQ
jgi:type I restriction enzyme S subunit